MGPARVIVAEWNPAEPNPSREGRSLVDASVTECIVPGQHLEAIGFMTEEQRTYTGTEAVKSGWTLHQDESNLWVLIPRSPCEGQPC